MNKSIITLILGAVLLVSRVVPSMAAVSYEYEKKDKAEEQKRYVLRLEKDKQKVDLAIANTKVLINRSRNRPYLPELYLRLAELYIEKSRIVFFIRKSRQQATPGALDQLESNMLKNQAIEIYQRILDHHSDFEDCDKVRFFMAHEYRELGQVESMVVQYRELIKAYPDSSYVPEAYLLLGDYFFNQKQDLEFAKRNYQAVLKYPDSPAAPIARYKLAWCHINFADFKSAITLFEEAVMMTPAEKEVDIDTYKRVDVRLESLIDMAYCYPEVYKNSTAQEALAYFQKFAWSRQVYSSVLEKLAYRYYVKKQWDPAADLYRQLAVLRQEPEILLEYTRHIFECVQAQGNFDAADRDVGLIIKALKKQKYSVHIDDETKEKNRTDYELYARDIITHLHEKARKSNSREKYELAANSYKQYLDFFKESPAREDMAGNYAEALFSSGQYLEAGKQYEKLVPPITISKKDRVDKLYSAVISYYNALKNKDDLNYFQVAYARSGLRTTGKLYAEDFPDSRKTPDVLFNVAWINYDSGKYEDAIKEFSDFVVKYPTGKAANAAVHLILDAYHLTENYEGLIDYGKGVLASSRIGDQKLKSEVARIVKGAESKVVSTMTLAAVDDWEKGKSELVEIARQSKSSHLGEQALNALIISSQEQGDLATLFEAGSDLVTKYPGSSKAQETLGLMIDSSLKIGQFRMLCDFLEGFAEKYPRDENTPDFLHQAAQIREGLEDFGRANQLYEKIIGAKTITNQQREEIVFAMAENAGRMNSPQNVARILTGKYGYLSTMGKIRADAMISDLYLQTGQQSQAAKYRNRALKAYKPAYSAKNPLLNDAVARMEYANVYLSSRRYMGLDLGDKIDNKVVAEKARLLEELEKGYQSVMAYKSPHWALKSCFRANEINKEFARFLKAAPLPELTAEEKKQYLDIIEKKAKVYSDKSEQYLNTCVQLARKWEICDPQLAGYFNPPSAPKGKEGEFSTMAGTTAAAKVSGNAIGQTPFNAIYRKLMTKPEDAGTLLDLANAYLQKGDFRQAVLIVKHTLTKMDGKKTPVTAKLYNTLGVSRLYCGEDDLAKDAFEKAVAIDSGNVGARINLAGVLRHYGHTSKAGDLYKKLSGLSALDQTDDIIHPRAGEFYYGYVNQSKK